MERALLSSLLSNWYCEMLLHKIRNKTAEGWKEKGLQIRSQWISETKRMREIDTHFIARSRQTRFGRGMTRRVEKRLKDCIGKYNAQLRSEEKLGELFL